MLSIFLWSPFFAMELGNPPAALVSVDASEGSNPAFQPVSPLVENEPPSPLLPSSFHFPAGKNTGPYPFHRFAANQFGETNKQ